jgi:tripartite motif-containing protein 71
MNRYWKRTSGSIVVMALLLVGVLAACASAAAPTAANPCALTSSQTSALVAARSSAAPDPNTTTFVKSTWVIDGAPNKFSRPTVLAQDEQGNLYVVDGGNHWIQKFDCNGQFLMKLGSRGSGEGQFVFHDRGGHFGAVTADRQGHIYVADHNFRIQKFTTDGKFLTHWGSKGSGDGQFGDYINLATDAQGNIYAVDPDNQRVQKFDSNGQFLTKWNTPKCSFFTPRPVDLAVTAQGDVLVVDAQSHCIQKFDSSGNFLSTLGKFSETDLPVGIALDTQGDIYVTDNQIGAIWKFDGTGNLLATWNSADSDYGQFDAPGGIVVDGQGNVYVVEVAGERIRKFQQP